MKKTVLTILSSFFCSFTLTAQTVTNLGTTTINRTISDSPIGDLTVGNYPSSWAGGSAYYRCIYAAQPTYTTSFNIGLIGKSLTSWSHLVKVKVSLSSQRALTHSLSLRSSTRRTLVRWKFICVQLRVRSILSVSAC